MRDPLTYRHPRSLEQAFGPGQRQLTQSSCRPFFDKQDRPVMVTALVGFFSFAAAVFMGWRP